MKRIAFVMSVNAGVEAEYARRHQPIWPELAQCLRDHGLRSYSIFLFADTRQLFAYAEVESEAQWLAISQTPECQRWWGYMAELMPHRLDLSPESVALDEVFHL